VSEQECVLYVYEKSNFGLNIQDYINLKFGKVNDYLKDKFTNNVVNIAIILFSY
jgi:hypothetical protein